MTDWCYVPMDWATDWDDYPDGFEFGLGDGDDAIFEEAWAAMLKSGLRAVSFERYLDSFVTDCPSGAMLLRQPAHCFKKLLSSEMPPEIKLKVAVDVATNAGCEIMFADHACATVAAMMFSGRVM